jgi:hypothetical protein
MVAACHDVHGIEPSQQRIKDASQIEAVWHDLLQHFERLLEGGKKGIVLAWGGKACNVEWMFRTTEDTHLGILKMPDNVPCFCDPKNAINHCKSCKLLSEAMLGYGCAEMWCHITNNDRLEGAHSSIVDARAQQDIVSDDRFMKHLDKPESVVTTDSIWAAKRKKRMLQDAELKRPLPKGWTEDDMTWEIPRRISYDNSEGGAPHGPSAKAKTVCENGCLAELFLLFFPLNLVETIARQTQQCGVEDWVRPVEPADSQTDDNSSGDESNLESDNKDCACNSGSGDDDDNIEDCVDASSDDDTSSDDETSDIDCAGCNDDDSDSSTGSNADSCSSTGTGSTKSRLRKARHKRARKLLPCKEEHPNARHQSFGNWIPVTAGFVIVWLGAALMLGAIRLRSADMMGGVDHKDQDTADWTVSLKSNRWCLRMFHWMIDGVLHGACRIVCSIASDDNHKWHKHLSKNGGRHKFQMDLGLALISHGLGMDWEEGFDEDKKPPHVRKASYVPCGCGRCFFCKNGETQGVDHKRVGHSFKQAPKETENCSEERTSLVKRGRPCKSCHRKIREKEGESIGCKEITKKCHCSMMGCAVCEVLVCKECWREGRPH